MLSPNHAGAPVTNIQKSESQSDRIDHPECNRCGTKMWLARISPDVAGKEYRMFECPVCEISTGEHPISPDILPRQI
jgi:hypothetical protein